MRVMVFGKATEDSGKGAPPTAEAFAAMDRFIGEQVKAGVFVAAAGLDPLNGLASPCFLRVLTGVEDIREQMPRANSLICLR